MGGGGLVCAEEGVVLPSCRQGLPDAAAYAIRLQRRVRELAGWVVGTQKSLVLPSCRQGLPAADYSLKLLDSSMGSVTMCQSHGIGAPAIFWCQQGQDQKHGWLISHLRVRALPALP